MAGRPAGQLESMAGYLGCLGDREDWRNPLTPDKPLQKLKVDGLGGGIGVLWAVLTRRWRMTPGTGHVRR